jgi:cytochrome oxidase Cu insertion factor (SCO1/SenC/PrrC family)
VEKSKPKRSNWALYLVIAICAAPVIASYFAYYVIKPEGRNNYGMLLDPRAYPIPELRATTLDGKPAALQDLKGKWLMLMAHGADCNEACGEQLFKMRQLRLMQGKEMDRVERVWLITDDKPVETMLLRQYDGTHFLRADGETVKRWLPTDAGSGIDEHIYMIDPMGNLMMRFPKNADPSKVNKDVGKLLKASRIG